MKRLILFFLIIIVTCIIIKSDIAIIKKQPQSIPGISGGVLLDNVQRPQINTKFKNQWGLYNIGANGIPRIDINLLPVFDLPKKDNTVVIGVLDTGVDINHIDLCKDIFTNIGEILNNRVDDDGNGHIDDIHGWDFVNNDNTVFDSSGLDKHGTLTAGIIKIVSANVNVKIIPLKVMEGNTSANTDILIKAINYARKIGVKIINCSWQGFKYDKGLEKAMKNSDILFICAAGNSSCDVTYIPSYPACYDLPNIISVGSINSNGEYSKFSNYGNKIHVAAPGENVVSTIPGDKYETVTGTSVAAPFVTGIAAIIKSLFPNLSSQDIARRIKENVFRIDNLTDKVTTGGMVDTYATVINDNKSLKCPQVIDLALFQGGVEIFWGKADNATSYELEIDRSIIKKVNCTSYKLQNIDVKHSHIYRVRSINGEEKSKWSISVKTQ